MAQLSSTASARSSKILLIGESGSGKTGSLVALAKAGYNLRVLDFDRGTEILFQMLRDDPKALARVDVETCTEDMYQRPDGKVVPRTVSAFSRGMKCLDSWPGLGKPSSWGTDTVLVLDSLTFLGKSIMNYVLAANGKLGEQPSQPNWGSAMELQENVLALLYSDSIRCHVIVMSHLAFIQGENEVVARGYPSALGSKLPPKVGRYFNSTLLIKTSGQGAAAQRLIYTNTQGSVECKTPSPGKVKPSYPIATGLADFFTDLGYKPELQKEPA